MTRKEIIRIIAPTQDGHLEAMTAFDKFILNCINGNIIENDEVEVDCLIIDFRYFRKELWAALEVLEALDNPVSEEQTREVDRTRERLKKANEMRRRQNEIMAQLDPLIVEMNEIEELLKAL